MYRFFKHPLNAWVIVFAVLGAASLKIHRQVKGLESQNLALKQEVEALKTDKQKLVEICDKYDGAIRALEVRLKAPIILED
jgi:hypothetical protein